MPTLLEIESLDECAELCRGLGLDFIELSMSLPMYQPDKLDITRLARIAAKHDIYYTIHLDENMNPCDFNEHIANAGLKTILATIEAAKRLGMPVVNMHLSEGVWFTLPDKRVFLFDKYHEIYFQKLLHFRNQCEMVIGEADIKICIENTNGYGRAAFLEKSLEMLLNSPAFALTFDIGHNAGTGFADEPIIISRIDKLAHMHIHDAKGSNNHLPLGLGELDLIKYLDLAKTHNCRAVLEVKTVNGLQHSVEWLRKKCFE